MCSGVTAYSAIAKLGALAERGPALLIGLGGVGMMGFSFLRARSQHKPIVVEIDAKKREHALANGAAAAFDPSDKAARKEIMAASGGGVLAPSTSWAPTSRQRSASARLPKAAGLWSPG